MSVIEMLCVSKVICYKKACSRKYSGIELKIKKLFFLNELKLNLLKDRK